MKLIFKSICFVSLISLLVCDNSSNTNDDTLKVKNLRIANEISGWTEEADGYREFNPSNMYDMIDGGVTPYLTAGLVEGIRQVFIQIRGTDTIQLTADVEDFGNENNAQNIFNTITAASIIDSIKFSEYPSTKVVGSNNQLGIEIIIFAHFNKFYFELKFNNYGNLADFVIEESKKFLSFYELKINSGK